MPSCPNWRFHVLSSAILFMCLFAAAAVAQLATATVTAHFENVVMPANVPYQYPIYCGWACTNQFDVCRTACGTASASGPQCACSNWANGIPNYPLENNPTTEFPVQLRWGLPSPYTGNGRQSGFGFRQSTNVPVVAPGTLFYFGRVAHFNYVINKHPVLGWDLVLTVTLNIQGATQVADFRLSLLLDESTNQCSGTGCPWSDPWWTANPTALVNPRCNWAVPPVDANADNQIDRYLDGTTTYCCQFTTTPNNPCADRVYTLNPISGSSQWFTVNGVEYQVYFAGFTAVGRNDVPKTFFISQEKQRTEAELWGSIIARCPVTPCPPGSSFQLNAAGDACQCVCPPALQGPCPVVGQVRQADCTCACPPGQCDLCGQTAIVGNACGCQCAAGCCAGVQVTVAPNCDCVCPPGVCGLGTVANANDPNCPCSCPATNCAGNFVSDARCNCVCPTAQLQAACLPPFEFDAIKCSCGCPAATPNCNSPSPSPTPTRSATPTPTRSAPPTASLTPQPTVGVSPSISPTLSPTASQTSSPSPSSQPTPSQTPVATGFPTPSPSPSAPLTPGASASATPPPSPLPSMTPLPTSQPGCACVLSDECFHQECSPGGDACVDVYQPDQPCGSYNMCFQRCVPNSRECAAQPVDCAAELDLVGRYGAQTASCYETLCNPADGSCSERFVDGPCTAVDVIGIYGQYSGQCYEALCVDGECRVDPVADGTTCSPDPSDPALAPLEGNPCYDIGVCVQGSCTFRPRPNGSCSDGLACTVDPDTFDPITGARSDRCVLNSDGVYQCVGSATPCLLLRQEAEATMTPKQIADLPTCNSTCEEYASGAYCPECPVLAGRTGGNGNTNAVAGAIAGALIGACCVLLACIAIAGVLTKLSYDAGFIPGLNSATAIDAASDNPLYEVGTDTSNPLYDPTLKNADEGFIRRLTHFIRPS